LKKESPEKKNSKKIKSEMNSDLIFDYYMIQYTYGNAKK